MKVSKRTAVAGLIAVPAGLSTLAVALAAQTKSQVVGKLSDDEVMRVDSKTGSIQNSNIKVSAAQHEAALANGAKEIPL